MASGWNLWVWLPCIGMVSGCCCNEVYIDILTMIVKFPYFTCIIGASLSEPHLALSTLVLSIYMVTSGLGSLVSSKIVREGMEWLVF